MNMGLLFGLFSDKRRANQTTKAGYEIVEVSIDDQGSSFCLFQIPEEIRKGHPRGFTVVGDAVSNQVRMFDWFRGKTEILRGTPQEIVDYIFNPA